MIDIHFHCLPGIDDGPRDWDEAVALCKAAAADGVTTIIATPHVLRMPWLNEDASARSELVRKLNSLLGGNPTVLEGCEYYFSSDALELWELSPTPLTGLNRSSYLLVEFPATRVPEQAESVLYEMSIRGVTPVIAHPERNLAFAQTPDHLQRFIDLGALVQVTAGSLCGAFGRATQVVADEFIKHGLVAMVASDAHSLDKRPPNMGAARQAVRDRWGIAVENSLFELGPSAILSRRPDVSAL